MAEYGFTGSDIASITSARAGLTAGFMQLGKQIQEDIQRIATIREVKAFGQELAQLDPTNDLFPQQLLGTLSKYPLASQTSLAKQGIEVLGARYKAALEAKNSVPALQPFEVGGGVMYDPRMKATYKVGDDGVPQFMDPTPQTSGQMRGTVIQTPESQLLINPTTGETIQTFAPRPASTRATNLNVLPQRVKMQVEALDDDIKAVTVERQKTIDAMGGINAETKPDDPNLLRVKQLEQQLGNLKSTRAQILQEQSEQQGLPSGSGQGNTGPSLMPVPQSGTSFIPMAMPTDVAAPQMTLRDETSTLPDQLPVLPGVVPKPKQAGTPRAYRKVGDKWEFSGTGRAKLQAIQQAYDDQVISEEEARKYVIEAGARPN